MMINQWMECGIYSIFKLYMEYGMLVFSCQADDIVAAIE